MPTKKKKTKKPTNEPTPQDAPSEETPTRPVQTEIPGTERVRIREIDDAAEKYVILRDKRMGLTEQECAAKQVLADLMHKHEDAIGKDSAGGCTYKYEDMAVILKPAGETLKVKHVTEEEIVVGSAPADDTEGGE